MVAPMFAKYFSAPNPPLPDTRPNGNQRDPREFQSSPASMKPEKIRLFIKPFCGWCDEAKGWLDARGITYEELDVARNPAARRGMVELTGQTYAPGSGER